jgi:hypothetical protein
VKPAFRHGGASLFLVRPLVKRPTLAEMDKCDNHGLPTKLGNYNARLYSEPHVTLVFASSLVSPL